MLNKSLFLIFFLFTINLNSLAKPLPPSQAQIQTYLASHQKEQLDLLKDLVAINSGTNNLTGIYQVGEILARELQSLGFRIKWVSMPNNMHRAATLVATHLGTHGRKILLIGHLDTVFPQTSPFQTYQQVGNELKGPGVIDDKGGDVVLLYALKALAAADVLTDANITVVLTGDEEDAGKPRSLARRALLTAAQDREVALEFEAAITPNTATIARRGIEQWTILAKGKEAHSSQIFKQSVGYGAIFELARILNQMRCDLSQEEALTFNPGIIIGGTQINAASQPNHAFGKANVVAQIAMAHGDLRFLSPSQKQAAENKMRAIVSQHLSGTEATIEFQPGIGAMPPSENNLELLLLYSQVSESLGYGKVTPFDPASRGAADIADVASMVAYNLAGIGALGTHARSAQETLKINSLTMQAARAALLIYALSH